MITRKSDGPDGDRTEPCFTPRLIEKWSRYNVIILQRASWGLLSGFDEVS